MCFPKFGDIIIWENRIVSVQLYVRYYQNFGSVGTAPYLRWSLNELGIVADKSGYVTVVRTAGIKVISYPPLLMLAVALLLAEIFVDDDYVYEEEDVEQYEEYDVEYEEDEAFEEYDVETEEFEVEGEEFVEMEEDVEGWYSDMKASVKRAKTTVQQTVNKHLWIVVGCLSGLVLLFMFTTVSCYCRSRKLRK